MAKITALPVAQSLQGTDVIPMTRPGVGGADVTYKVPAQSLLDSVAETIEPYVEEAQAAADSLNNRIILNAARYWQGQSIRIVYGFDPNGRASTFELADGSFYARLSLDVPDLSIAVGYNRTTGRTTLQASAAPGIRALGGGAATDTHAQRYLPGRQIMSGFLGSDTRAGAALLEDGVFRVGDIETDSGFGLSTVEDRDPAYAFTVKKVNGKRQIFRHAKAGGAVIQLTSIGSNNEPRLSSDGTMLLYASERYAYRGRLLATTMMQAVAGGPEHPYVSRPDVICLGDSLTYSFNSTVSYPQYLQNMLAGAGVPVSNFGLGGQVTSQMAIRIGAMTAPITVAGNQIAAGANSVTAINGLAPGPNSTWSSTLRNPEYRFLTHALQDAVSSYGTFNGIYGTMTRTVVNDTETYTFTPDPTVAQTLPAACPAGSAFQAINDWRDKTVLFYGGYNDLTITATPANTPASVKANIDLIVAYLAPKVKRYLVFTVATGGAQNNTGTGTGGAQWTNITSLNAQIKASYPDNTFDNWTYLIAPISDGNGGTTTAAMKFAALAPTQGDLTDIAGQIVPRTLRTFLTNGADPIHLQNAGYQAVAQGGIYPIFVAKGWSML